MSILSIARTYRNLRRMREIVQVLSRYGFGHLVVRMNLLSHIPLVSRIGRLSEVSAGMSPRQDLALRARMVLEELGPTFIKMGQMLSYRPDILNEEFLEQFRLLQDKVAPFDGDTAREIVEKTVQGGEGGIFSRFDAEPLASGSIGQVHTAALADGTGVVVKVKRPGIEGRVRDDLNLIRVLAELAEYYLPELRILRPVMVVDEFSRQLEKELDFVSEGAFTSQFRPLSERLPRVATPRVFWDSTCRDVLVLEKLDGVNIGDVENLDALGVDKKALAWTLAEAFLVQFFETGLFHGDPHPGNILVREDGSIGLIDFGTVGHLSDELRADLGTLALALQRGQVELIVDVYRDMGVFPEDVEAKDLKPDILEFLDRYAGLPLGKMDTGGVFQDLLRLARKHRGILPRDFVLLGKSLVAVAGLTKRLDPSFQMLDALQPYIKNLIREKFSPKRLTDLALEKGWTLTALLGRLPRDAATILRKLQGGKLKGVVEHQGLEPLANDLERSANRLSLSMILASMVLGSGLLTLADVGPPLAGDIPLFGTLGFLVSLLAALFFALTILRSGRI